MIVRLLYMALGVTNILIFTKLRLFTSFISGIIFIAAAIMYTKNNRGD